MPSDERIALQHAAIDTACEGEAPPKAETLEEAEAIYLAAEEELNLAKAWGSEAQQVGAQMRFEAAEAAFNDMVLADEDV